MKNNTHMIQMQPVLLHVAAESDKVYTPPELALDMVSFFKPSGVCLDPCKGSGTFLNLLPAGSDWCEIEEARDFYAYTNQVDWIVSNPPYTHYSAWMRHSMKVSKNIVYLIPAYKLYTSARFLSDMLEWGGIVHQRFYGSGSRWGFPFGQALFAVHYQAGYRGDTSWSSYK